MHSRNDQRMFNLIKFLVFPLFILIVQFFFTTSNAQEACSSTIDNSCAVYTECIERTCNCASTEFAYSARFGPKYCGRFGQSENFSEAGIKWRDKTLSCLKEQITRSFYQNIGPPCNCKAIQVAAIESHSFCYALSPSVCELPDSDIREIANIVDKTDILSLGLAGAEEIWESIVDCRTSVGGVRSLEIFYVYLDAEWDQSSTDAIAYVQAIVEGAVQYAKSVFSDEVSLEYEQLRKRYPTPISPTD